MMVDVLLMMEVALDVLEGILSAEALELLSSQEEELLLLLSWDVQVLPKGSVLYYTI